MDKKKILGIFIKVSVPVVVLAVILVVVLSKNRKNEFSLTDYAQIDIKGVDGNGKVNISLDKDGLYKYFVDDDTSDSEAEEYKKFVESVYFDADVTEELSNGDEVIITAHYDAEIAKALDVKTGDITRKVKVSGLKDGVMLDAFKELQIITSGVSPYVTVTYNNQSSNEYLKTLEYSISRTSGVKVGDTITITCKADEDYAATKGYYFDTLEMNYTIDKADVYVEKETDINKSVLNTIVEDAKKVITEATADTTTRMTYQVTGDKGYLYRDGNEEAVAFELYKAELAYNATSYANAHHNYIMVYLKGQIRVPNYSGSEDPYEYIDAYFCFVFYDAIRTADGEFCMAVNELDKRYICGRSFDEVKAQMNGQIGQGYNYTEINLQK